MRKLFARLAGILFAAALLSASARAARADGLFSLTASFDGEEWESRLRLESLLWRAGPWRAEFAATIPQEVKSGDEAYADLALSHSGDPWRWTGTFRLMETTAGSRGFLQLRGTCRHREWSVFTTLGEQDLSDPSRETGIHLRVARSLGKSWRLSAAQGWAEVITNVKAERHRDYTSEASLTWRGGGRRFTLLLGGKASRGEEPEDDRRNLYGELEREIGLGLGWSLASSLRVTQEEKALAIERTTALEVDLRRRAPLGVRCQASWTAASGAEPVLRAGIAVAGGSGGWRWRVGAAAQLESGDGATSTWTYAGLSWEAPEKTWRLELGLSPSGEYAVNTRHGYWIAIERRF